MRIILFLSHVLTVSILFAQENCSNGFDDDGDGLVDCYDSECGFDGACDDSFFGNSTICASDPNENITFKSGWSSPNKSAVSYASPLIGDLDQDGKPEVITVNSVGKNLIIINGENGEVIAIKGMDFEPSNTPLIADIDSDGMVEIFITERNGAKYAMFNMSGGEFIMVWSGQASLNQPIGIPGIADFNEDGEVEIYYRNEIIDASSGEILIEGSDTWLEEWVHAPLAIDILAESACSDCAGLELVTGNEIWAVNQSLSTRTLIKDMNDDIRADIDPTLSYFPKLNSASNNQWSAISSADYTLDGNLDLMITGALGTSSEVGGGESTIFLWDVANSSVQTFSDPSNDPLEGAGRIAIEDIDLDGFPNAVFTMGPKVYALDENLDVSWTHPIVESKSAVTIFDLHGDSQHEVFVKDGDKVLALAGSGNEENTTSIFYTIPCKAVIEEEAVVIGDIDGDGSVEICLACFTDDETSSENESNAELSQIRVFEAEGLGWVPGRSVWNQYNYHNVNVNDDLTIPVEVQDHSVVFSSAGACEFGDGTTIPYPSRALNTFGSQSTIINEEGCKEAASPDFDFVGIVNASDLTCINDASKISFKLTNIGDRNLNGGDLLVSYYFGDPRTVDGILLETIQITFNQLKVNDLLIVEELISDIPGEGEIYVHLNNPGSTPPIPVPFIDGIIRECEYSNNIQSITVGYAETSNEITASICQGDTYIFGNQTLTVAGEYVETFPEEEVGCQEVTLTLTVNPTYSESVTRTICQGEFFVFNSEILSDPGEYSATFQSVNSCDSLVNLTLVVEAIEAEVSLLDGVLTVDEIENATYQWIDCSNSSVIVGETESSYFPSTSGSYSVTIESDICEITSACFDVVVLSNSAALNVQIFPNPITELLNIQLQENTSGSYRMIDLSGKNILQNSFNSKSELKINTSKIEEGVYILELTIDNKIEQFKILKD